MEKNQLLPCLPLTELTFLLLALIRGLSWALAESAWVVLYGQTPVHTKTMTMEPSTDLCGRQYPNRLLWDLPDKPGVSYWFTSSAAHSSTGPGVAWVTPSQGTILVTSAPANATGAAPELPLSETMDVYSLPACS